MDDACLVELVLLSVNPFRNWPENTPEKDGDDEFQADGSHEKDGDQLPHAPRGVRVQVSLVLLEFATVDQISSHKRTEVQLGRNEAPKSEVF